MRMRFDPSSFTTTSNKGAAAWCVHLRRRDDNDRRLGEGIGCQLSAFIQKRQSFVRCHDEDDRRLGEGKAVSCQPPLRKGNLFGELCNLVIGLCEFCVDDVWLQYLLAQPSRQKSEKIAIKGFGTQYTLLEPKSMGP
mmetsp:Transcript_15259/g.29072  ORF Transcript_15259/g.29072 Transcript_15259/m.29072 type:complete len:137 (-) Transcript_15259:56-466(-)